MIRSSPLFVGGIFRFKTDHTVHRAGYPGFHPRRLFGAGIRTAPRRSGRLWLHRSGARPAARPPRPPERREKKRPASRRRAARPGVLLTVFGGIGLGLVFLAALIVGLAVLVEEDASFSAGLSLGVFLPLLLLCVGLLAGGGQAAQPRTPLPSIQGAHRRRLLLPDRAAGLLHGEYAPLRRQGSAQNDPARAVSRRAYRRRRNLPDAQL